jgi:hypothetical protein
MIGPALNVRAMQAGDRADSSSGLPRHIPTFPSPKPHLMIIEAVTPETIYIGCIHPDYLTSPMSRRDRRGSELIT